jgi:cell division transport system permease protein
MFISLKRIIRSGLQNFFRNSSQSGATVFILTITVISLSFLFLFHYFSQFIIEELRKKADISVYFKEEVLPEEILKIKSEIEKLPETKEVKYVSKEKALEKFIERHKNEPILLESLEELGENPFLASLNVKFGKAPQYEKVTNFLATAYGQIIEKIDYHQRKPVIDKIFNLTSTIKKVGIIFILVSAFLVILVAFNTIKLAILNSRQEIQIMKLVGASNWFVRGPFLIQGIITGIFAVLISLLIFSLVCYFISPKVLKLFPELNIFDYFLANFWQLVLIQIGSGVGLGVISSLIAIRKYLKI